MEVYPTNYSCIWSYPAWNNHQITFLRFRTGFVPQPLKWSPVARVKHRRITGSNLRWGTVPPLVRRGAASPKSDPLWSHLLKQTLKHLPPLKIQPLPWLQPWAQRSLRPWSPTQRTMLIQAKTDSPSPRPPGEANPRGCRYQSSSAFVDPGDREEAHCKCYGKDLALRRKLKQPLRSKTKSPEFNVSIVKNNTHVTVVFCFSIPLLSRFQGTHFSICTHSRGATVVMKD